jgi:hypothetical protein
MQLIKVTNQTSVDISCGMMTYQPNIETTLFDKDDQETYVQALEVLTRYFDIYKNLALSGELLVVVDGVDFVVEQLWDYLLTQIIEMNRSQKIGYLSTFNFYFNMHNNKFTVINPVDGEEYTVQMYKTSATI